MEELYDYLTEWVKRLQLQDVCDVIIRTSFQSLILLNLGRHIPKRCGSLEKE